MKLDFLYSPWKQKSKEEPPALPFGGLEVILLILTVYYFYGICRWTFIKARLIASKLAEKMGKIFSRPAAIPRAQQFNINVANNNRNPVIVKQKSPQEVNNVLRQSLIPLEDVLAIVECMVCLETVSGTYKTCTMGHLVCGACVDKIQKCPTCGEPIANKVPICVKQLVELIPHVCRYSGCDHLVKYGSKHEKYCKLRTTTCRIEDCSEQVTACDLLNHQETKHRGKFQTKRDNPGELRWRFNSPDNTECTAFFEFFNGLYSLELVKIGKLLEITFSVVYIDGAEPLCCIVNLETERNGLKFNCTLEPSLNEEITPSMEVSQEYVARFLNLNGDLVFKYEIKPRQ